MAEIYYHAVPGDWRREQKYAFLDEAAHVGNVAWTELTPDARHNWLTDGLEVGFDKFPPIGSRDATQVGIAIFRVYCNGVKTQRDLVVYDFCRDTLSERVEKFISAYNLELLRYQEAGNPKNIDAFVNYETVKWSSTLKNHLNAGHKALLDLKKIRECFYRPFTIKHLYYDPVLLDRPGAFDEFLPTSENETENRVICLTAVGNTKDFHCLVTNHVADLHLTGDSQCFPFYTYNADGAARRENIPDAAQIAFWKHYGDESITKWDVFHYVYALLHHPGYRERFAGNLRRSLPHIPFAPDFRAFADAGRRLAELHVGYETAKEFPLRRVENRAAALSFRVEKMRFTAPDRAAIRYNEFLTLEGIPPEAHAYRLGNRSALEWALDQFAVSHDKASGLTSDPNRLDDETYILRLLGQVITVSVETVRLIAGLPGDFGAGESPSPSGEAPSPDGESPSPSA